ncbi:nose resistant to fluoxetine protein 6-like [Teleopsis dalmanni]|uniref:nose resistant to fluoxetine protein 6-like n=1 Tax=Teleopsis dalmanni TaxID=139649 RepID=UPI0018CEDBBA|nr:nose resistant to fluoxetine protein 6-like [Teleopsis dalmanni]
MCRYRWKVLIAVVILCASHLSVINANNIINVSTSYYHNQNHTPTVRQYAIINGSNLILPIRTHYAARVVSELQDNRKVPTISAVADDDDDILRRPPSFESHLEKSSVIYALAKLANESNVNAACHTQLKQIQRGILRRSPWAMKVLDASGTKPSGFVFGQNFWLGSRESCNAAQNPVSITLSKNFERVMHFGIITERAPFDMNYGVVYLRHNSPWQVEIKLMSEKIIHVGLCLPSTCQSSEIQQLTTYYVERGLFVENDIYDIRPEVAYMKDLKLNESFYQRKSLKMLCTLLLFTSAMMLCASLLREKSTPAEAEIVKESGDIEEKLKQANPEIRATIDLIEPDVLDKMKDFVKCFDVQENYEKLVATKEPTNASKDIPVINGLRSVCAIWIMIFHVVWFMYFTVNNKTFLISYAEQIFFQYVSSAPLLVDVFFTISGFLQVYNFMRNTKQMDQIRKNSLTQNLKQFFKLVFHRYLRLGPLYLVILAAVDVLYAYIADVSVYHINERFDEMCSQHWWRNLLFIQNFFKHLDMCANWTWSLACEMQYFLLATILLFIYAKHPKFVKSTVVTLFAGNVLWTYCIGLNSKFQLSFDAAFATGTEIYISPFVRILPYIMGAVSAWYLFERQQEEQTQRIEISETKEKCCWNLSILVFFVCIYSTIKRDISYLFSISLFVIGRYFFSLTICWMIVGSATGRGIWWSRILEAKVFQHVNRLSYAIYLLNPFVIGFFFSFTNVSTHADPFMLCVLTSGFVVIVYLAAIVFSLAFEMPYSNWSSLLSKRRTKLKSA